MAQLTAIVTTQVLYGAIGIAFIALYGLAVRMEWNSQLAPRSSNRPKAVLKNALQAERYGCGSNSSSSRSSWMPRLYPLAFLLWSMRLTYPQGLQGIPGTGSRNNGWAGPALRWNLDGVILLKYHRLLSKVALLATVLCLGVLLPAFMTAECDPTVLGMNTCEAVWNMTDFENLTIAHIPDKLWDPQNYTIRTTLPNGTIVEVPPPTVNPIHGRLWVPGVSSRTLLVVICCVILYVYTCYLLWHEWLDNLALRRVYFLESDHYPRRIKELDEITAIQGIIPPDEVQENRPPYIPDPELRDTPPSVGLYSVLYQLPESLVTYDTDGATQLERQVVATTTFFDECCPAQPGFSSSVAAVTIVPDASRVAKAWMKWYKLETKLRRLRYIRKIIQHKLEKEANGESDVYDNIAHVMKISKHGVATATHTVAHAVVKRASDTGRQLSSTLSATMPLATHSSSSMDQSAPDAAGLAGNLHTSENDEQQPLVSFDNNDEFVSKETSKADKANESTSCHSNIDFVTTGEEPTVAEKAASNDERKEADPAEENPLVTLWSMWMGGNDQKQNVKEKERDIEMQPLDSSKYEVSGLSGSKQKTSPAGLSSRSQNSVQARTIPPEEIEEVKDFTYEDFDVKSYAKKLGFDEETELNGIVDGLGIEQLSVFAREYAQSSANPCVYGMSPQLLNFKSVEDLQDMENELIDDLREANEALQEARQHAIDFADDEEGLITSALDAKKSNEQEDGDASDDIVIPNATTEAFKSKDLGLRNRNLSTANKDQWEMAQTAAIGMRFIPTFNDVKKETSCFRRLAPCFADKIIALPNMLPNMMEESGKAFVTALDHPTYAVVTFTSRQAAIAARQSLADGGAINAWKQVDDIPIFPLADAPPRNIFFFRGCCRPVTLTINYKEKKARRYTVVIFLFFFCCLYTIPLASIQNLANPDFLKTLFPNSPGLHDPMHPTYQFFSAVSGPFSSLMLTLFFSFLPQLFKFLAFYDGTSSSMEKAERFALLLYWYFMLVTAFAGASLANMFFRWLRADFSAEESIREVLNEIAGAIPGQVAPTWLNWIIMRYSFTWTGGYLFQMNAFITKSLNLKWLNRVMRGGGPGPPPPYRIYVDSGVVFMCIMALSPACPLIAPAALIYFSVVQPILRWLLIFVYRPKYDGGGDKWPQAHQMIISAMILGQILMAVTLSLKAAYWEGICVGCCAIPTYFFHLFALERFYRPFHDCALLQTSRLDSWQDSHSLKKREEYRRWLVDCHKASYVPICLLGTKDNLLTAEPAVVVPKESDEDTLDTVDDRRQRMQRQSAQKGAIFNRKYM